MKTETLRKFGQGKDLARLSLLIFVLSYLIYIVFSRGQPSFLTVPHSGEVVRVALSVAEYGTFADPYHPLPTGYTAHTAPLYVLFFAAIVKLFGEGFTGAMVLWGINSGFLALQLALLPVLSKRLGLGVGPGVLAAVFGMVFQPYRVLPEWESLMVGALMVLLCVLTIPYFQQPGDWKHSLLLGFLWGVGLLANPQCVLLLLVWPHFATTGNQPQQVSRARRAMLVVLAGTALVCLPWFIRNYERFHAVFFIRDNLGLELATSNNSCAQPTVLENFLSGCHQATHPNSNAAIASQVFEKGEIRFNQDELHTAIGWIKTHPRHFASLTLRRFLKFWFPYLQGLRYAIPSGVLTVLSFAGLAVMFWRQRLAAWVLASTLGLYPLIHYIVQFEARYRYPIYWATFLPAAYFVLEAVRWLRKAPETDLAGEPAENELSSVLARDAGAEGGS
jgi:hypothetical protein